MFCDRKAEKSLGIDDIKFYTYWYPDADELEVTGQYIASGAIKSFRPEVRIYDLDGDLLEVEKCTSYLHGNGFETCEVKEELFFGGYPFSFSVSIKKNRLPKVRIRLILRESKRSEKLKMSSDMDLEKLLKAPCNEQPRYVAHMQEGEKFPKSMVTYYSEGAEGIETPKFVFYKGSDNSDEYWANYLKYTLTVEGKPKKDLLVYIMLFNEKSELIDFELYDIFDDEEDIVDEDFFNVPPAEKIARTVVYTGPHPHRIDYADR